MTARAKLAPLPDAPTTAGRCDVSMVVTPRHPVRADHAPGARYLVTGRINGARLVRLIVTDDGAPDEIDNGPVWILSDYVEIVAVARRRIA